MKEALKQLDSAAAAMLRFAQKTGAALLTLKGDDANGTPVWTIVVALGENAPPIVAAANALNEEEAPLKAWTNGEATYAARSAERALELYVADSGEKPEDVEPFHAVDGDKVVTVKDDTDGSVTKRTAAEWVALGEGEGFLFSTEA